MIQETSVNTGGTPAEAGGTCSTPASVQEKSTQQSTQSMPQSAGEAKQQAREKAGQAAHRLSESMNETARQVRQQAGQASHRLREQGQGLAEQQKERVADEIATFGAAAHQAADKLDEEDDRNVASYAHAVGEQLDRAADYLRQRNLSQLADDTARLARQRPEVFFGGMFLAGMSLARFLKASGRTPRHTNDRREHAFGTEMHPTAGTTTALQHSESQWDGPAQHTQPAAGIASGPVITHENTLRPAEREPFTHGSSSASPETGSPLAGPQGGPISSAQDEFPQTCDNPSIRDEDRPTPY